MTDTDMIEAMARAIYERVNGSGCRPWRQIDHKPAYRDQATAAIAVVQPEIDRLRNLVAILQQQAEIHAQEARTANATIYEAYQAVTGATGEPGNWNGARDTLPQGKSWQLDAPRNPSGRHSEVAPRHPKAGGDARQ